LHFARGEETATQWYVASEINLLKTRHTFFTQHQAATTTLQLDSYIPPLQVGLAFDQQDETTTLNGHLALALNPKNLSDTRLQEERDLYGLGINVSGSFTRSAQAIAVALAGDARLMWGNHQTQLSIAPRFSTTLPNLAPLKRALQKERLKKLLNPVAVRDALQEFAADSRDDPSSPLATTQNDTDVRRNGSNGSSGLTLRLTQDYQQMAQQVVIIAQDAREKAADVGVELLYAMERVRVSGRKRVSRKKTRLWLEGSV
jgi:hypothetical protein